MKLLSRIIFAAMLLVSAQASATTWYVSSVFGNDSTGDGKSIGTAWATLQKVDTTGVPQPGDIVYVVGGYYGGGTAGSAAALQIDAGGSAAGGYVTWSAYPGTHPIIASTAWFYTVWITAPYVIFTGFDVVGPNSRLTLAAAQTNAVSANATLYQGAGIGITDGGSSTTIATNATTAAGNATLHFASTAGVVAGQVIWDTTTTTVIPSGTTVLSTTGTTVTMSQNAIGGGVGSGNSIKFDSVPHHIQILNNSTHDFPGNGIESDGADYLTVSGNTSYNNTQYYPGGGSCISIGTLKDIDPVTTYKTFVTGNVLYNCVNLVGDRNFTNTNITTNGTTAAGNAVLHFASTTGVIVGDLVWDLTTPGSIATNTTVLSTTGTTVTMSANAISGGVGATDSFHFSSITDGEGIIIDTNNANPAYVGRTLVANNLAFNNGSGGVSSIKSNHVDLVFNTSYLNQRTFFTTNNGEIYMATTNDTNIFNNYVQASGSRPFFSTQNSNTSISWGNNGGFGGNGTVFPGSNNITADPLWVAPALVPADALLWPPPLNWSGFQLKPGSPAIDAGSGTFSRTTDILGNPGLTGPSVDMGAYESPCTPYGANVIRTPTFLTTSEFQDGQAAGSITPSDMRDLIASLSCGRSPYAH